MNKMKGFKLTKCFTHQEESMLWHISQSENSILLGEKDGVWITTSLKNMMITGEMGSGKSTFLRTMLIFLFYTILPEDLKLILIEVRKSEFSLFQNIPHLACPILEDTRMALNALCWLNEELERRKTIFSSYNLPDYKAYKTLFEEKDNIEHLPILLLVIDEYADLINLSPKESKEALLRFTQIGETFGIYVILSTKEWMDSPKIPIPNRIIFKPKKEEKSFTLKENLCCIKRKEFLFFEGNRLRQYTCIRFDTDVINRMISSLEKTKKSSYLIFMDKLRQ